MISGKKEETVLNRSETKIFIRTASLIGLWSIIAVIIWSICMKAQGMGLAALPWATPDNAIARTGWCIIIYSYAFITFYEFFGKRAADIVVKENHKYMQDHEEGMIQKNYVLGFVNSYFGMSFAAFVDQKLIGVAMLLALVLALKQFVMNFRKWRAPRKSFPPKFAKHWQQMIEH